MTTIQVPADILGELVEVAGMAVMETLDLLADSAQGWTETHAQLNDAVQASRYISTIAYDLYNNREVIGELPEDAESLRRVVQHWAGWCECMDNPGDPSDPKAPASEAWWSEQAAKANRVIEAMGWDNDEEGGAQ